MSYLGVPRLVFFGKFETDPSTVNNDPEHFDTDAFSPNYWQTGQDYGWWNPLGTASWRFTDTVITAVSYGDASTCTDGLFDAIVGAPVGNASDRVAGRIVDLDPEQQMISQIWGLELQIGDPLSGNGFRGSLTPTGFSDIWARVRGGSPDSMFSAVFQSVIEAPTWGPADGSRAMNELRAAFASAGDGAALSVRFVVDAFDDAADSPSFTFGRVSGAIGVAPSTEPRRFVAARRVDAQPSAPGGPPLPSCNGGPATLVSKLGELRGATLTIDLGNSFPTAVPGGPFIDIGEVHIALTPPDRPPVPLASVGYRDASWYESTSGIVSIPLGESVAALARTSPIAVFVASQLSLAEAANGVWVRADENVFRMNPSDEEIATLHATRFGEPYANEVISFVLDDSTLQQQVVAGPIPGPPVGVPTSAIEFAPSVTTDASGVAEVRLRAADPGNPRGYIDGQVYCVAYAAGADPPPVGSVSNTACLLNALVWSGADVPANPTWLNDIEPIFTQYANLYPVMKTIVDLSDYANVVRSRVLLLEAFSRPIDDPGYMPVTRDLSRAKRDMICRWLKTCRYMRFDVVTDLVRALQRAVELEHATIPPYLCALYSIKAGTNIEVARILRSVIVEEMLHLTLVANLLTSIGSAADLGKPGFVPIYPGPLPGGLVDGLTVRLRRCSIEQIRDVFMTIERGHRVAEPVHGGTNHESPTEVTDFTIGWFYREIERAVVELHESGAITFGHVDRQVTRWPHPVGLAPIASLADARAALQEIRHQGEGSGPFRPGDRDGALGHYYRFAEIVNGRQLVVDDSEVGFSYSGESIPFDEADVWPMIDDPVSAMLPRRSHAARISDDFSNDYRSLLNGLHRAFNGEPDQITSAMSVMFSLGLRARQLMTIPIQDGVGNAGPVF